VLAAAFALAAPAQAGSLRFCADTPAPDARGQDRLLQLAALAQQALAARGARAALVARSGLALDGLGLRYSHAGIALRDGDPGPWTVRQLFYACDEGRPRLFDQGWPGFVLGMQSPQQAYLSVLLLPEDAAAALADAALDRPRALALAGPRYSANAHAFSTRYQNCNQWVAELMASAWGGLPASAAPGSAPDAERAAAQAWLRDAGYEPAAVRPFWRPLAWLLGLAVPWVHEDDHPPADLDAGTFRLSLPTALEAFVRARWPGAQRLEFCVAGDRLVEHAGWDAVAAGCVPGPQDRVTVLD